MCFLYYEFLYCCFWAVMKYVSSCGHMGRLSFEAVSVTSPQIFSYEKKWYNRKDLARHRTQGDPDDTSHRGHPLCKFCDERYLDNDELLKHLRRDHYFCHFCDADGAQEYYRLVKWNSSVHIEFLLKALFYSMVACKIYVLLYMCVALL